MSKRALVVDDSRALRMLLSRVLRVHGFETMEAQDGLEALRRLEEGGPVELVLLDWNMPSMNGYELICAIRAQPRWRDVRLVLVTTPTDADQTARALAAGADGCLLKPFTPAMLVDKLTSLGLAKG